MTYHLLSWKQHLVMKCNQTLKFGKTVYFRPSAYLSAGICICIVYTIYVSGYIRQEGKWYHRDKTRKKKTNIKNKTKKKNTHLFFNINVAVYASKEFQPFQIVLSELLCRFIFILVYTIINRSICLAPCLRFVTELQTSHNTLEI